MATQTTLITPKGMHLDIRGFSPADIIPDFLGLVAATPAGYVSGDEPAVRVPFLNFDSDAGFVAEGATIPTAAGAASEVVIHTGKVAVLVVESTEQATLDTSTLLSDSIRRAVLRKANAAFLAQVAPTVGNTPPAGLLHLGATDGGTINGDGNLDALTDAVASIEAANGTATTIIAAPDAWGTLSKLKIGETYNSTLLGSGTLASQRLLSGLPVYVSASMPSGKLLVIDKGAVLVAAGQVMLAVSADAAFANDALAIRVTFRFGQKLVSTARVVSLTVAP